MTFRGPFLTDPVLLDDFVDLQSVPPHRQLKSNPVIERMRLAVPFDHIIVSGLDIDNYRFGQAASIDSDLPPAFVEAYASAGMVGDDPFVQSAKKAKGITIESEVWKVRQPSERLLYLTQLFNVHNRTLIPVSRGSIVYGAVCFTRSTPFHDDEMSFLSLVAEPIHTAVTRPLMEKFFADSMRLASGELTCLRLASLGYTSEAIAKESGFTADTVNSYIKTAIRKLGASNRVHAIAEALRRRLIK